MSAEKALDYKLIDKILYNRKSLIAAEEGGIDDSRK